MCRVLSSLPIVSLSFRRQAKPIGNQVLEIVDVPVEQERRKLSIEGGCSSLHATLGEHHEAGLGVVSPLADRLRLAAGEAAEHLLAVGVFGA